MDEIVEWSILLGGLFILWYISKQKSQQQALQEESIIDNNTNNIVSYKELMAKWQPLDYEKGNINDLKNKLQIAVANAGGDIKIQTLKQPSEIASEKASYSQSVSQSASASHVSQAISTPIEAPTLGINTYSNHERWRVVRGLDKRIIGYVLERDANIKST